jgi:hypothetical protein
MIKCYLIDIKNIASNLPKSKFSAGEIEQLADWILDLGGLIRPLILKQGSGEKYKVIEGHLEYYAAARANEKNPAQADQVNAFIIPIKSQQTTIDQLAICDRHRLPQPEDNSAPEHNQQNVDLPLSINLLLPVLSAAISQQLQPILDQLDQHKQLLTALSLTREKVEAVEVVEVVEASKSVELAEVNKVIMTNPTSQKTVDSSNTNSTKSIVTNPIVEKTTKTKTTKQVKSTATNKEVVTVTATAKPPASKKANKTAKPAASKQEATSLTSIDPIKATKTIDLINILSQDMLTLRMKQSKIPGADKLAINIVAVRNLQPTHKFHDWDSILGLKISGLGVATILKIIDKLK